jgi:hypothetical protein
MATLFPTSIVGEWGSMAANLNGRQGFLERFPEVFDPYGTDLYVMERLSDARFNEAMRYLFHEAGATVMEKGADAGRSSLKITFETNPRPHRLWTPIPVLDGSDKVFFQAQEAIPALEALVAHYEAPVAPVVAPVVAPAPAPAPVVAPAPAPAPVAPRMIPIVARMFEQARAQAPLELPPPVVQLYQQTLIPVPFAPAPAPPPADEWVPVVKRAQRAPAQEQRQSLRFCRFGGACREAATCPFVHGDTLPRINRACNRGQACPHRATCVYIHPGERYTPGDLIYRHH